MAEEKIEENEQSKKKRRRDFTPICVYCLEEEKSQIQALAKEAGLSVSDYLRRLGLMYRPTSVMDYEKVGELLKTAADMGRLGGLLKWWLSGEAPRLKTREGRQIQINEETLRKLLARVDTTNRRLQQICEKVIDLKDSEKPSKKLGQRSI